MNCLPSLVAASLLLVAVSQSQVFADSPVTRPVAMRDIVADRLLIGSALQAADLEEPRFAGVLGREFNCITPGNEMKPDALQRVKGTFTFERAEQIVAFAQKHNMKVIGHTLLWHSQAPRWLFESPDGKPLPREEALENLRTHITTVVRHFKGRVHGWDVVNEAVADSPDTVLRDTPARRAIGDDYVIQAFKFAQDADPDVELYYNDYNIEAPYKRERGLKLVKDLLAAGVRVDGVGIQGHWLLDSPSVEEVDAGLAAYAALGVKIMVTEMDVDPLPRRGAGADVNATETGANPYTAGLPVEVAEKQAERYARLFDVMLKYAKAGKLTRISLWGLADSDSWLNDFPVRGRTNHPLLFDRAYQPKPAHAAVVEALRRYADAR